MYLHIEELIDLLYDEEIHILTYSHVITIANPPTFHCTDMHTEYMYALLAKTSLPVLEYAFMSMIDFMTRAELQTRSSQVSKY